MFRAQKGLEAVSHLLVALGGEMPVAKLSRLLYLADREHVRARYHTIADDSYIGYAWGQVPQGTLKMLGAPDEAWDVALGVDNDAHLVFLRRTCASGLPQARCVRSRLSPRNS